MFDFGLLLKFGINSELNCFKFDLNKTIFVWKAGCLKLFFKYCRSITVIGGCGRYLYIVIQVTYVRKYVPTYTKMYTYCIFCFSLLQTTTFDLSNRKNMRNISACVAFIIHM